MIEIRRLTEETAGLLWTVEDRRLDSERVVVRPRSGGFDLDYKPLPGALWRVGNRERDIPEADDAWLGYPDKRAYFAWMDDALAGQILIDVAEETFVRIRDVRVELSSRRKGVGEALMNMAEDWARRKHYASLLAETQDVNAGACQFLTKCGFELGGIDTLRYTAMGQQKGRPLAMREGALFFYKILR